MPNNYGVVTTKAYDNKFNEYIKHKKLFYQEVQKKLLKSVWPLQTNDFYFMTMPKGYHKFYGGKIVPVDWQLSGLIAYLWDEKFITTGIDQGNDNIKNWNQNNDQCFDPVFISFNYKTASGLDAVEIFKKKISKVFKVNDIVIIDISKISSGDKKQQKQIDDKIDNALFDSKLIIILNIDHFVIEFRNSLLNEIYNKLGIEYPKKALACPGGLITRGDKNKKYVPIDLDTLF